MAREHVEQVMPGRADPNPQEMERLEHERLQAVHDEAERERQ